MSVCLVGTRWGYYLGTQLRQFYRGALAVCGRDNKRTQRIARRLDAECLIGYEAAIHNPDVRCLILAIPAHLHTSIGCAAMLAGKHVLVEKPLSTDLEGCDALIRAAHEAGVVLAVGENIPYRPAIREAKRLLPEIGEPKLFFASALHNSTAQNDLATGILLDFSVHHIRAVRELYGEPDLVYASRASGTVAGSYGGDNVTMVLSSSAGWQATVASSWQASAGTCPEFIATGSRGAIKIWPESSSVDLYPAEPQLLTRLVSQVRPYWLQNLMQSPELQRRRFKLPAQDRMGYQAELREFMEKVERGRPDVSAAIEARRDLEVVMAAQRSLDAGRPIACHKETQLQVA